MNYAMRTAFLFDRHSEDTAAHDSAHVTTTTLPIGSLQASPNPPHRPIMQGFSSVSDSSLTLTNK